MPPFTRETSRGADGFRFRTSVLPEGRRFVSAGAAGADETKAPGFDLTSAAASAASL